MYNEWIKRVVLPPEEMVTDSKQENGGKAGFDATDLDPYLLKDPEAMAMNFARALENLGQAASAWLAPRERGEITESAADPMTDMVKTLSKVTEYWISDPRRTDLRRGGDGPCRMQSD
ncbi:hypothetical protein ACCS78_32980, partial [Rhizobium johnstonii]